MKNIFAAFVFLLLSSSAFGQVVKIDTLYYDREWKGVPIKEMADFYRVAFYPSDTLQSKRFRDYYITGELAGDGSFITINRNDDAESVFDGEVNAYYKNGNKSRCYHYSKGVANGTITDYFENGCVASEATMNEGVPNGLMFNFLEDGTYSVIEFENGNLPYDYYLRVTPEGYATKIRTATDEVFWEEMSSDQRKSEYRNGVLWQYYTQNGLIVAVTCKAVQDRGRYHQIQMIISNNSITPIEFNPEQIGAMMVDKKNDLVAIRVWPYREYMSRVNKRQTLEGIAVGLAEGLATMNAGYTTSTTNTNSVYGGVASGHGTATVYGSNGGYAVGSYDGVGAFVGGSASSSTTSSYNASAAYQTMALSQQRMSDFTNKQWQERAAKDKGYLKKTIIYPGETISGFVNIDRPKSTTEVLIHVPICGVSCIFDWEY